MSGEHARNRLDFHPIVGQMAPSAEQLPAIVARGRDVVVTAGAGTGKTRTLVARYLSLLAEGCPLRGIVAITFTNKAAREMRNRVREEMQRYMTHPGLGDQERQRWQRRYSELDAARIGTIHSLCSEILRAHPAEAGIDPLFNVLDEGQGNLLRSEAVRDTMAWAADTARVVDLFGVLGEMGLQSTLDSLLRQRLEVSEVFVQAPADLETWEQALHRRQESLLAEMSSDERWQEALKTLWAHKASKPDDRMEVAREQALTAVMGAEGTLPERLCSLRRLDDVRLVGGSQTAWPGGAEERDEVKKALGTLRSLWRERADILDLALSRLDALLSDCASALRAAFEHAQERYEALKGDRNSLDFDDLEGLALELLENNREIRERWQDDVVSLLVDEFQDTNDRQRNLVRNLNGDRGRLFIVGDAKQSIYRFRGADVTVFREERQKAKREGGSVYSLDTSYRAHRALLEGLNCLLAPVLGEQVDELRPWVEPFSPLVGHREEAGGEYEAPFIELHLTVGSKRDGALQRAAEVLVERVIELVEGRERFQADRSDRAVDYGEVAILCRASGSFGVYENALERAGVPFLTVAGRGFYDRPEIRDLLNALQAVSDPTDDLALVGLLRSPVFGVSDVGLTILCRQRDQSLWGRIRQGKPGLPIDDAKRLTRAVQIIRALNERVGRTTVADLLKGFLDQTDYRAALIRAGDGRAARNVSKLLADAQSSGIVGASEFLEYITGLRDTGIREGEARGSAEGAVQIMSIHAAKGLEFPVVVIGDLASGGGSRSPLLMDPDLGVLLPLKEEEEKAAIYWLVKQRYDDQEAAELARLLYVAATRAREKLLLSGNIGLKKDRTPTRVGRWLEEMMRVEGIDFAGMAIPYDGGGAAATEFDWRVAGQAVRCTIYEPGYSPSRARTTRESGLKEPARLPPRLLGSIVSDGREPGEEEQARGERDWRAVPRIETAEVPSWLAGSLVHAALAAWRFPRPGFRDWIVARAQRWGIAEERQLGQLVDRVEGLLQRFRATSLYREMATAEQRLHEVPYSLMVDGQVETGVIDVLFQRGGNWTLVEFKTNHVPSESKLDELLADEHLVEQVARYKHATSVLLGKIPRFVICLLDYRGAVREIVLS